MLIRKTICMGLVVCLVMFCVGNIYASKGGWIAGGAFGFGMSGSGAGALVGSLVATDPELGAEEGGFYGMWLGAGIGVYIGSRAPDSDGAKTAVKVSWLAIPLLISIVAVLGYVYQSTSNDVNSSYNVETDESLNRPIGSLIRLNTGRGALIPPIPSIEDSILSPNHRTETDVTMRLINVRF